jgi:Transposase
VAAAGRPSGPRAVADTATARRSDGGNRVGQIASWVGLDVGKQDHHATVISAAGERLFELTASNDEAAVERLLARALESGRCALVIDQPGSIGSLAVCVARRRGVPVAYVPGLVMRRASELYPGEAKTDRRDSLCWRTLRAPTRGGCTGSSSTTRRSSGWACWAATTTTSLTT